MNLIYTKKKMLQLKKIFHLKHYIIAYSSLKCIFNYNLLSSGFKLLVDNKNNDYLYIKNHFKYLNFISLLS